MLGARKLCRSEGTASEANEERSEFSEKLRSIQRRNLLCCY